jgi:predicted PurR-regulated permease PerM
MSDDSDTLDQLRIEQNETAKYTKQLVRAQNAANRIELFKTAEEIFYSNAPNTVLTYLAINGVLLISIIALTLWIPGVITPVYLALGFAFIFLSPILIVEKMLNEVFKSIPYPIKWIFSLPGKAFSFIGYLFSALWTFTKNVLSGFKWFDKFNKTVEKEADKNPEAFEEHPYRMISALLVLSLMMTFIIWGLYAIIPELIEKSLVDLDDNIKNIDKHLKAAQGVADKVGFAFDAESVKKSIYELLKDSSGIMYKIGAFLLSKMGATAHLLEFLILTPLYMVAMIANWEKVVYIIKLVMNGICTPDGYEDKVDKFADDVGDALRNFAQGKMIVMFSMMFYYSIAYSIIGIFFLPYTIPLAVVLGAATGFLCIMPVAGMLIGVAFTLTYTIMVVIKDMVPSLLSVDAFVLISPLLILLSIVGVLGYILEGKFLDTYFIGKKLEVHGFLVIFAIVMGGTVGGLFGMFIATPVLAILTVIIPAVFYGTINHLKPENREAKAKAKLEADLPKIWEHAKKIAETINNDTSFKVKT